jgi:zeta-carotene desaturase
MEGAVRSGRLAAGAVVGDSARFIVADTAASGLMRWFDRS